MNSSDESSSDRNSLSAHSILAKCTRAATAATVVRASGTTNAEPVTRVRHSIFPDVSDVLNLFSAADDLGQYRLRAFGAAHKFYLREGRTEDWSKTRQLLANLMEHALVEIVLAIIISANSVLVIMETDMMARDEEIPSWLKITSAIFLCFFCLELALRFYVARHEYFYSYANTFDFVIVLLDVISEIVSRVIPIEFSFFRMFRLGRLLRFLAVLTMFNELRNMITLMIRSMWALLWGSFFLAFLILCWAILAVQFLNPLLHRLDDAGEFYDCPRCKHSFESVGAAFLTFTSQLVFGDSWGTPTKVLIEHHPASAFILIPAGITTILGLMNIILTVIVDKAHEQKEEHAARILSAKEEKFLKAKRNLENLCADLDHDKDGEITLEELVQGFDENPEFALIMSRLDIARDDVPHVFSMLDDDASGSVSYMEFVDQVHKMRAADLRTLVLFVKGSVSDLRHKLRCQILELSDAVEEIRRSFLLWHPEQSKAKHLQHTDFVIKNGIDVEPQLKDMSRNSFRGII